MAEIIGKVSPKRIQKIKDEQTAKNAKPMLGLLVQVDDEGRTHAIDLGHGRVTLGDLVREAKKKLK